MSVWTSKSVLERCKAFELRPRFRPGERVARGFADLGIEEFCLMPGEKLMSLLTGAVTALPEEHKGFFFRVPSIEELTEELELLGLDDLSLAWIDRRSWNAEFTLNGSQHVIEGHTIREALLNVLEFSQRETR